MILLDNSACDLLKDASLDILSPELLHILDVVLNACYHNRRLKSYSCFDGDNLYEIETMRIATQGLRFTPINPECVLGYYVSVQALYTKHEVMKCCLALVESCDELWIFARNSRVHRLLTEGMLAEVMLFREHYPERHVRVLDLEALRQRLDYARLVTVDLIDIEIGADSYVDEIIAGSPASQRQEINEALLAPYRREAKYPLVYMAMASRDIKYLDWARAFAFKHRRVPVNRHAVLGSLLLRVAHNNSPSDMLQDVLNVMDTASELWIFGADAQRSLTGEGCLDLALELQLWFRYCRGRPVRLVNWCETQVPKYSDAGWALTSKERLEVEVHQSGHTDAHVQKKEGRRNT